MSTKPSYQSIDPASDVIGSADQFPKWELKMVKPKIGVFDCGPDRILRDYRIVVGIKFPDH